MRWQLMHYLNPNSQKNGRIYFMSRYSMAAGVSDRLWTLQELVEETSR
jgi:hypothetical protein